MRVVFMGTPSFAVPTLLAVAERHDVVAVYARPDAASGRGSALRPSPVRAASSGLGVPVLTPSTLRTPDAAAELAAFAPDVVVVAAYGLILPEDVLAVPPHGCVNVHASLLPRWRGAAPVQRAILAGDAVTGVSIMRMEAGLDTGPWALRAELPVDRLDTDALTEQLAHLGADALVRTLDALGDGSVEWVPQDDAHATYAEKVTRADVALAPELAVADADRRVRASSRSAPCAVSVDGRRLIVVRARPGQSGPAAGDAAATADALLLGFADGTLAVEVVRPEGRGDMAAASWANGARLPARVTWASA